MNFCQGTAAPKSSFPNACHAIKNANTRQRTAIPESTIPDACHAIRNVNTRQRTAIPESTIHDACHAIRDNYSSKGTDNVFTSHFLSAIYALNGRKVIA